VKEWLTSGQVFGFPHGPTRMRVITGHRKDFIQKKASMVEMSRLRAGDDPTATTSWKSWGLEMRGVVSSIFRTAFG